MIKSIDARNSYLVAWATFGAHEAQNHERGMVILDIHKENIVYNGSRCVIVDLDQADAIDFPNDWQLLATPLFDLLCDIDDELAAAFRFGYLHHGGPISRMVFDLLRSEYRLNSLRNIDNLVYKVEEPLPAIGKAALLRMCKEWREFRDRSPLGDISSRQQLDVRHLSRWRKIKERKGNPEDLRSYEYHYEKHLLAGGLRGSLLDILEAILNLHVLYFKQQREELALSMAIYSERMLSRYKSIPDSVHAQVKSACDRTYERFNGDKRALIENLPEVGDILHWIWCASDIERGTIHVKASTG